jgi:hypothetical protein
MSSTAIGETMYAVELTEAEKVELTRWLADIDDADESDSEVDALRAVLSRLRPVGSEGRS